MREGRGGRVASPGSSGGKQGGRRWPSACRRASATRAAYWREEDDRGGVEMGWAGFCSRPHRYAPGRSSALFFIFLFYSLLFNLLPLFKNQNRFKNSTKYPLDIFMLLNGLIQMHIKCSRVFESIFYTYYEYNSKCN